MIGFSQDQTVLLDQDFTLRDSFERWSSLINQHVDNSSAFTVQPIGGAGIYQNWQVYSLDRQGIRRKGYNFVGCWPSEVSGALEIPDLTVARHAGEWYLLRSAMQGDTDDAG